MILTLLRIHWTNLRRDRVAQALTFLLPIAFFTIFALVFSGSRGATSRVPAALVDEGHSAVSQRLARALTEEKSLRVRTTERASRSDSTQVPLDRARAERMVRDGEVPVAIVLPAGLDTSLARFDGGGTAIRLLCDPSDPIAPQMVSGLLQKAIMTALPDQFLTQGVGQFERYGGALTPQQRKAVDQWLPQLRAPAQRRDSARAGSTGGAGVGSAGADLSGLARVETVAVAGRKEDTDIIAFYAAGIAVMFLLFSCSGIAGTLLDEVDAGTLERVLSTRLGMTGLLAGKWIYLTLIGVLQICVMFLYARLVFRLDLLPHLPGFFVMTFVTAAVAGSFGLFLATLCRTRAQLGGISTIVIIILSALGGSMFPRFLMSEGMQKAGLLTFNAWALDGFTKVFWRDASVPELWPQVLVLLGFLAVFLGAARLLARRWEQA